MMSALLPLDPTLAGTSRFIEQKPFVVYKGILSLYFLFWCIRWPIADGTIIYLFVTYWGWYTATLYFVLSFITACLRLQGWVLALRLMCVGYNLAPDIEGGLVVPAMPSLICECERRLIWWQCLTWNIACQASLIIALVFWSVLYEGGPISSTDLNAHLFVATMMVIDQMLIATPYRFRHLWTTQCFGIIYICFNVTWYYLGAKDERLIYSILDWDKAPVKAVIWVILICVILVPAFAALHFGAFRVREFIYASCRRRVAPNNYLADRLLDQNVGSPQSPQNVGSADAGGGGIVAGAAGGRVIAGGMAAGA